MQLLPDQLSPVSNLPSGEGLLKNSPTDISSLPSGEELLNNHINTPDDVSAAQKQIGSQNYNNYCETFVEKMTGAPNMGTTAAEAWNNYAKQGKAYTNIQNAPAGSLIYFAPDSSNRNDGHVAITDGQGNITGATSKGIATYSINDWMKMTGQQPLGFVPTGGQNGN